MPKEKPEKREDKSGPINPDRISVVSRNITTEMKESFIDYAMSVITDRALPDVRDGLKPVHRRILFSMYQNGLTSSAKFRKCATVVGDVLGSYHPHGDASVYEAMVKMAQPFSLRYPLILGQGNFGNIDGDGAAAYRYTEAKMTKLSAELLQDLEKETVSWRQNYDGTKEEPSVLPTLVPNLLLNGTLGIAVGMATSVPPHNIKEIIEATELLVDEPDSTNDDLMKLVKGPDFPTGGLAFNEKDIHHALATGKGGVLCRGEAEIVETKSGMFQIVITSIPYRVVKSTLMEQIADLVREKKVEGIKGLRDESAKDIRVVVDIKSGAHPQNVLNYLYKHTQLEETFHYNMVALVDGVPQTLSLKSILQEFIGHRKVVIKRRTEFDLRKAEEREHILIGLKKALDHIDEIIQLIKKSKDVGTAHTGLMTKFKFSDRQATAILEMRLSRLAALEREKIEEELKEIQALIAELKSILANSNKILVIIKKELSEIREKYGDDRLTKIVRHGAKNFSMEDLVSDDDAVLVLTSGGYVKRTNTDEYRKQKRGGVGVIDLDTKEEDFITHLVYATLHSDLLFFTDKGKAFQIKMYELPEGKRATKGKSIMNFLSLSPDEKVTSVLVMPKESKKQAKENGMGIMFVTRNGVGKKCDASSFHDVRRSGIIAIKLSPQDELVTATFVEKGDDMILVTKKGQSIRFKESDIREMGRSAGGVTAMRLDKNDSIVGADVIKKDMKQATLLVMGANGYGKTTDLEEYKVQKRAGSGIKTAQVTAKTGDVIASKVVADPEAEIVAISKKSQVIRVDIKEIPELGRQTQGVRVMKLREGDSLASMICF
jgi:DNA gyrase subunit A